MSIKIGVFSDYVCPYCLLIEGVLAEATQGLNVDIQYLMERHKDVSITQANA